MQGKEDVDVENAIFGLEGDGPVVFFDNGRNAFGAETVIIVVLAVGDGQPVPQDNFSFIIVARIDGQEVAILADCQVDVARANFQIADGVDGIFQDVAKEGIDVRMAIRFRMRPSAPATI